jgi:uncharacterized protein (DUF1015 family)
MRIHAYRALRPRADVVSRVAAPPYDTVDTAEALQMAGDNPMSFLHVNHSEIDLPAGTNPYAEEVYAKAAENFRRFVAEGWLVREDRPLLYLYAQTMGTHTQTGLVCCCHVEDYVRDVIKKHEFTRKDKEDDRTKHTAALNANVGPVFIAYRDVDAIRSVLAPIPEKTAPLYDFVDELNVRHRVWTVEDVATVQRLFAEQVPVAYIADGHHRSASAVRVGTERRAARPPLGGEAESDWFLSVLFPASELRILPYNRVVKDLNGRSPEEFLAELRSMFSVEENAAPSPASPRRASLYLGGKWHGLAWPDVAGGNPVDQLDVSVLQNRVLGPLLGIDDPRTSGRIKFVGGIRGPEELVRLVDEKGYAVAFSMYPTTVDQLMAIADAGQIMPPKSTWFEPKLRTGLLSHELD